jgi:hypothetical protein
MLTVEMALFTLKLRAIASSFAPPKAYALLPFKKPMSDDTAYLGGISMHLWTWAGGR